MPRLKTKIYRPTPTNLRRLARALQRGELVAVPSETVYGLAANALDARACAKIFKAKNRPSTDPLIVHIAHARDIARFAHTNPAAKKLAAKFWPGPLTLILPKKEIIPALITAGGDSVALRLPAHPVFRALLKKSGLPLAAPSANPFSYVSPTTAQHVLDGLGGKIAHIIDGGPCQVGLESTIIDLRHPEAPKLLRLGAISAAQIAQALGRPVEIVRKRLKTNQRADAPGSLQKHYSPKTRVVLHAKLTPRQLQQIPAHEAVLRFSGPEMLNIFSLCGPKPNLTKAAHALFAQLRALDAGRWKKLHVELAPGASALAAAINDRLQRAAAK